jgi:YHS domain-containing protein
MTAQASPGGAGYPPQEAYNAHAAYQPSAQAPQLPPGCPPAALDGNCPVTLMERRQWATGNRAWGAIHRGRTYLFVGPDEKEKFLANPDFYSPVLAGNDPVLALDNQMLVPGRREFGFFGPDNRVYLFADEASLKRFEANPRRYAAEVLQAQR